MAFCFGEISKKVISNPTGDCIKDVQAMFIRSK